MDRTGVLKRRRCPDLFWAAASRFTRFADRCIKLTMVAGFSHQCLHVPRLPEDNLENFCIIRFRHVWTRPCLRRRSWPPPIPTVSVLKGAHSDHGRRPEAEVGTGRGG